MTWLDYCFYSQLLVFVEQNDTTRQCHSVKNTLCTLFYLILFLIKKVTMNSPVMYLIFASSQQTEKLIKTVELHVLKLVLVLGLSNFSQKFAVLHSPYTLYNPSFWLWLRRGLALGVYSLELKFKYWAHINIFSVFVRKKNK